MSKREPIEDRANTGHAITLSRLPVVGAWENSDGEIYPISRDFYNEMTRLWPKLASNEEKMSFVLAGRDLIEAASKIRAESGGDRNKLKPIADDCRRLIRELPTTIPRGGFGREGEIERNFVYNDSLSAEEIEAKLWAELERWQLIDWYEIAETEKVTA